MEGGEGSAGLWILTGKKAISSVIHRCITCWKIQGKLTEQKMSDLPSDRLIPGPPFNQIVGCLDVFGPWNVMTPQSREGSAENKSWTVLFMCLNTRAVHIEMLEIMSTSSFISALTWFLSTRGSVTLIRSNRGTIFVGACRELNINSSKFEELRIYLQDQGCTLTFNPPHTTYMGGVWERMISIAHNTWILDAILMNVGSSCWDW